MTRKECIDGMQRIIDEDQNKILVRVHVGYLIHAIKYLKDQHEIVRCKDCWKRDFDNCPFNEFSLFHPDDDFFCADGEKVANGNG
jgi:hypothetical protein